jgi:hypothetical protein
MPILTSPEFFGPFLSLLSKFYLVNLLFIFSLSIYPFSFSISPSLIMTADIPINTALQLTVPEVH